MGSELKVALGYSGPGAWHPNRRWLGTGESYGRGGDNDRKMHLHVDSGKVLGRKAGSHYIEQLQFSPDGHLLAAATNGEMSDKGTLRVWRHEAGFFSWLFGSDLTIYDEDKIRPRPFLFTADSKRVVATGADGTTVELLDVDGPSIASMKGHTAEVKVLAVSPDGKQIASADGRVIKLWDQATGKPIRDLASPGTPPIGLAFDPSGRLLAGGLLDGSIRLWNLDTGAAVTLATSQAGQWMVFDDAGHFDGSRDGVGLVAMVDEGKTLGIEQLALQLNRPDLLLTAMGGDAALIAHYRGRFEQRLRKAGVSEGALATMHAPTLRIDRVEAHGRTAAVKFTTTDSERDLRRYQVSVDGAPLYAAEGKPISGRTFSGTETVELPAGPHEIEVSATNVDGAESYRAQVTATGQDAGKPTLWFLGFGVSRYADSALSLKWAHRDATELGAAFAAMAGKGEYGEVKVKTFTDAEVTVQAIREAKKHFAESRPGDTVVLFVAGHGVHDRDAAATYYYLTHEAKVDDLRHTAAPFELVEDLLQGIGARRKLFLMDTCESGELDDEESALLAQTEGKTLNARAVRGLKKAGSKAAAPVSRPFVRQRDRFIYNDLSRRSGAIVLSSSRGGEFSYEQDDLQHGLFTTEILAALTGGAADADHDGLISPQELRDYVSAAVARRSNGLQNPTVDRDNLLQRFRLPLAK